VNKKREDNVRFRIMQMLIIEIFCESRFEFSDNHSIDESLFLE
jgi:hypothetical protein